MDLGFEMELMDTPAEHERDVTLLATCYCTTHPFGYRLRVRTLSEDSINYYMLGVPDEAVPGIFTNFTVLPKDEWLRLRESG